MGFAYVAAAVSRMMATFPILGEPGLRRSQKIWTVQETLKPTYCNLGPHSHLLVAAPKVWLQAFAALNPVLEGLVATPDYHPQWILRSPLRSTSIHLRGRYQIGSRRPQWWGSRRGIPR